MKSISKIPLILTGLTALCGSWVNAAEVNLYTTREPALIQPLLKEFTRKNWGKGQYGFYQRWFT